MPVVDRPEETRKPTTRVGFARRTPDLVCHLLATFEVFFRWRVFLCVFSTGRQRIRISACSAGFPCVHEEILRYTSEQDNCQDS